MAWMTRLEAGQEALRRWGPGAWASTASGTCQVGVGSIVAGDALSWEDSFAMAENSARLSGYLRMCERLNVAKGVAA